MPDLALPLPCRRPELVSRPFGDGGTYLVRDRLRGESFRLGPQEHFLLARLDGSRGAGDLRAAFAERFGDPLTAEDLQDFLDLAQEHGFLQPGGAPGALPAAGGFHEGPGPAGRPGRPAGPGRRLASWLLGAAAAALQWPADRLSGAARRIRWARFRHLDFVPRPDDVFLVTYPRSGTTWVQMILYQLTTDGGMDLPHIAEYCPWFERSLRSAGGFETRPSPRLFKSHLTWRDVPRGPCRYIYVARDGRDVAVSYYHLYRSYNGFEGTFAEFFDLFLRGRVGCGSWFAHVKGWWARRRDPNVLFLTYEELTRALEGCVRRIIAFCGFDVPPGRLPAVLERCGFAFMKRHECRFDPALETLWEQGIQLNSFLRKGRVGEGAAELSPEQEGRFNRAFARQLGRTGIAFGPEGREPR
jgi:hypothetical protein